MIPKIIHYCWLSDNPIPNDLKEYVKGWKKKLPDYEFILWDKKRFPLSKSTWVEQAYKNKKYAFAADYIRLYALYYYGGIYLDMDVEVLKSFDDLLKLEIIFGYENSYKFNHKKIEMATIGSKKGHWLFHECLLYYDKLNFINEDGSLNTIPMPNVIEMCLKDKVTFKEIKNKTEIQTFDNSKNIIPILPESFFSPKSYLTGELFITNDTYSVHHFKGSWQTPWKKIKIFIRRKFKISKLFL